MQTPHHRVFAIRYGRHERTAKDNFISVAGDPNRPMPMDYFIWLVCCADGRSIVVDTGFDEDVIDHDLQGQRLQRAEGERCCDPRYAASRRSGSTLPL